MTLRKQPFPASHPDTRRIAKNWRMCANIEVRLRICRAEDLPALEWMGLYTRHREIIRETFAQQRRGEGLMLLGVANDFPLAQAWLDFARRGSTLRPCLWALRVFPPLQGAGIGTWMIQAAESVALDRGAREIELSVEQDNTSARRLYERLGYRAVAGDCDNPEPPEKSGMLRMPADRQIMRKRLRCG